jgi:hypothetical protein
MPLRSELDDVNRRWFVEFGWTHFWGSRDACHPGKFVFRYAIARAKTGSPKNTAPSANVLVFTKKWFVVTSDTARAATSTLPSRTKGVFEEKGGVGDSALSINQLNLDINSAVIG